MQGLGFEKQGSEAHLYTRMMWVATPCSSSCLAAWMPSHVAVTTATIIP